MSALDTHSEVVAITGRASGNVVPFKNRDVAQRPVIAYLVVDARPAGGAGNNWEVLVQFSALSEDDDDAATNQLAEIVNAVINPVTLLGLTPPLDAYVRERAMRDIADDAAARADIDITLIVTN